MTGYIYCPECLRHDAGAGHPERPERLEALRDAVDQAGLSLRVLEGRPARREDLLRVHTADHVATVEECCASGAPCPDPDTSMGEGSWDAALMAAGAGISAAEAVLDGRVEQAFCAVRPPGHHAEWDRAMGFCLFNNVAVTARWLQEERQVERVAILDWDVHHGNGTQHAFYDDESVFYASLHQFPFYPGTGAAGERGAGQTTLNCPMDWGAGAGEWLGALKQRVLPELEDFAPDFLLISAGFDGHYADPLAAQQLDEDAYAEMTRMVKDVAGGRIVSLLEGGYDLDALGKSVVAHLRALGA